MDSAAIAFVEKPDVCLTIDYGHAAARGEIRAAAAIANTLGIAHHVVRVDHLALGSGDLAGRAPLQVAPVTEWWPFRNQMLVTVAAMWGIGRGVAELLIGCVGSDSAHRDGRIEFIAACDQLLQAQEGGLRVRAPAIAETTAEYVRRHEVPREVLAWAHSCHAAEWACGECRGCAKSRHVSRELYGAEVDDA